MLGEKKTHDSWFSTSRGKHSNSLNFLHTAIFPFSQTYAERRSHPPLLPSPFPPNHLLQSLSLFASFPLSYSFVLYIFSVFSASSSRRNVTTFTKAFDLDAGGCRRGRRIRIKRTDCGKLVESLDEIHDRLLRYPSIIVSSDAMFSSRSRVARSILFRLARPSFFYRFFSCYYYRRWHRIISPRDITWKIAKGEKVARSEIVMHECIRRIKCWKTFWRDGWLSTRDKKERDPRQSHVGNDTFAIEFVYHCSKSTHKMYDFHKKHNIFAYYTV